MPHMHAIGTFAVARALLAPFALVACLGPSPASDPLPDAAPAGERTPTPWPTVPGYEFCALNLPAQQVSYGGRWEGDEYVMWVEGVVNEWILFGPHLELRRRLWARLGENKLHLSDVVGNA